MVHDPEEQNTILSTKGLHGFSPTGSCLLLDPVHLFLYPLHLTVFLYRVYMSGSGMTPKNFFNKHLHVAFPEDLSLLDMVCN